MSVHMHYRIIGLNISECRLELRLTQEQLSEQAGISQQYLSRLECGKAIPSLQTVMALCDALDVRPDRLLSRGATHDDASPNCLRSDSNPSNDSVLIAIDPEDLPIVDLELPDTDFDYSDEESHS